MLASIDIDFTSTSLGLISVDLPLHGFDGVEVLRYAEGSAATSQIDVVRVVGGQFHLSCLCRQQALRL